MTDASSSGQAGAGQEASTVPYEHAAFYKYSFRQGVNTSITCVVSRAVA